MDQLYETYDNIDTGNRESYDQGYIHSLAAANNDSKKLPSGIDNPNDEQPSPLYVLYRYCRCDIRYHWMKTDE